MIDKRAAIYLDQKRQCEDYERFYGKPVCGSTKDELTENEVFALRKVFHKNQAPPDAVVDVKLYWNALDKIEETENLVRGWRGRESAMAEQLAVITKENKELKHHNRMVVDSSAHAHKMNIKVTNVIEARAADDVAKIKKKNEILSMDVNCWKGRVKQLENPESETLKWQKLYQEKLNQLESKRKEVDKGIKINKKMYDEYMTFYKLSKEILSALSGDLNYNNVAEAKEMLKKALGNGFYLYWTR